MTTKKRPTPSRSSLGLTGKEKKFFRRHLEKRNAPFLEQEAAVVAVLSKLAKAKRVSKRRLNQLLDAQRDARNSQDTLKRSLATLATQMGAILGEQHAETRRQIQELRLAIKVGIEKAAIATGASGSLGMDVMELQVWKVMTEEERVAIAARLDAIDATPGVSDRLHWDTKPDWVRPMVVDDAWDEAINLDKKFDHDRAHAGKAERVAEASDE